MSDSDPSAAPTASTDLSADLSALSADFWEARYREGTDRWDLGQPAPPFVSLLASVNAPQPGRIAVLGAGRGHDALLFAAQGFDVVGFDFAPFAVEAATQAANVQHLSAQFLQRDIFALASEFADSFQYVLEHTCFCAISPQQRAEYVSVIQAILQPGGELIGLFWCHPRPGGPPYGVTVEALTQQFSTAFEILALEPVNNSVDSRQNEEYLARMRVRK
jgi:methyl halide transferase